MKRIALVVFSLFALLSIAACDTLSMPQNNKQTFDYYIDCTTQRDIFELSNEPFVESVFSFTVLIFQRPGFDNPMNGQIAYLATPSFDDLDSSPYYLDTLIRKDDSIMEDPSQNPALICESLASAEHLSPGDTFYQETSLTNEPLSFTVAGVFRQTELFAQYEAVVLINDQITKTFAEKVDELGYTNAYVKASDVSALKTHFETEFIPHLLLGEIPEEEIGKTVTREELNVYYEDYETHMNRMQ